jgi:hypothetical protein
VSFSNEEISFSFESSSHTRSTFISSRPASEKFWYSKLGSRLETYEYMSSQRAKSRDTVSISEFLVTSALRMTSTLRATSFCSMLSNLRRMR